MAKNGGRGVRKSIPEQLHAAWKSSGLTLGQLIELCKFEMDETSLGRKLNGKQVLSADEIESLANELHIVVTAGREARAS